MRQEGSTRPVFFNARYIQDATLIVQSVLHMLAILLWWPFLGDFEQVTKPLSSAVGDADSLVDNDTVGKIQGLKAKETSLPHEL